MYSPDSSFPVPGYGGSESNLCWMKVLGTFVQNPDKQRRIQTRLEMRSLSP
jgi:hypothetical protein